MPTPSYAVGVAWSGDNAGEFRLDYSALDGTDILGDEFTTLNFTNVTSVVKSISISRGRSSDLGAMQPGNCRITLRDLGGTYNPENPTSPLAGSLVPMRPVRVRATYNAVTYGLFYGFLSRLEHDPAPAVKESVLDCIDFFEWLGVSKPEIGATGSTTVGAAIGLILTAIGWTDPAMRNLDTGSSIPDFSANGSKTAQQLIQDLLTVDLGVVFVDGSGVVRYVSRENRFKRAAVAATLSGQILGSIRPSTDVSRIVNRQRVTRTGGTEQEAVDQDSRRAYGYRDGSAITSPYLSTDADAVALAGFLVLLQKDPRPPTRAIGLSNRDQTSLTQILAREIGDRVTLTESEGGTSTKAVLEGVTHDITDGGLIHRTRFLASRLPFTAFTLDASALDGTDLLTY